MKNPLKAIRDKIRRSTSVKKTKIGDFSSKISMSKPMPRVRYSASSTTRRFR
jgi:hypothetical protein